MNTYIVTFEVDDSRRELLRDRLKKFSSYCPIHGNCWAVLSDKPPAEIRDFLVEALSDEDRIFVIRSGTYSAWRNAYSEKHSDWLKEKL